MGIPLLTPTAIKDSRQEDLDRVQRRSIALATEESSLVQSLNLTRDSVDEQKGELAIELQAFEAQAKDRKAVILEEISHLEHQRDAIMAPIEGRQRAVEEREKGVLDRESAVTEREGKVRAREEEASKREDALPAAEQAIKAREDAVQPKEDEQAKREESIKAGWAALTAAQDAHSETVRTHAEENANARAANDADAKANAIEREHLAKRKIEHDNKDREIADRYAQLAATAKELGIPQTP